MSRSRLVEAPTTMTIRLCSVLLSSLALLALTHCNGAVVDALEPLDSGTAPLPDADATSEAGTEAGREAGREAGPEAGPEAGIFTLASGQGGHHHARGAGHRGGR